MAVDLWLVGRYFIYISILIIVDILLDVSIFYLFLFNFQMIFCRLQ